MNWDAIGAIGQMLGALALFLVFLQVRHAREETRRSVSQSRSDGLQDLFIATRVSNERMIALKGKVDRALGSPSLPFVDALVGRVGITEDEASTLQWDQMAWWMGQAQSIRHASQLSEADRSAMDLAVRRIYGGNTLSALWYETMKATLNPDAVRYVDNLLAQPN